LAVVEYGIGTGAVTDGLARLEVLLGPTYEQVLAFFDM
jgi:hypothetical protein